MFSIKEFKKKFILLLRTYPTEQTTSQILRKWNNKETQATPRGLKKVFNILSS